MTNFAGKPINPYQGLKQNFDSGDRTANQSRKTHKSLSGIETVVSSISPLAKTCRKTHKSISGIETMAQRLALGKQAPENP